MSTELTSIFGSEIKVMFQPRGPQRQFTSYAGAHGATSMLMGSSGYPLIITGTLRVSGADYNTARKNMVALIEAIESWAWAPEQVYTYRGERYQSVVFERLNINRDSLISYDPVKKTGILPFTATFRSLL